LYIKTMEIFIEITIIMLVATFVAFLVRVLRQPLIIGYILSGIILGPSVLNLIQNGEVIEVFSKLGITVLLFIVGINLNPQVIRDVGKVSFISGISQVVFTSIIGFFLARFLGLDNIASDFSGRIEFGCRPFSYHLNYPYKRYSAHIGSYVDQFISFT